MYVIFVLMLKRMHNFAYCAQVAPIPVLVSTGDKFQDISLRFILGYISP
jgi:hypothetical protein